MARENAGRPMEILLIEDDVLQARLVLEAVRRGDFGHRVSPVRDGQEALNFIFRRGVYHYAPRPDLILLDLRLPSIDGLDVLEQIKGDHELASIPVVIMTSSQSEEDRLSCEKQAVEGYITKPMNPEKFLSLLKQLRQFWRADMLLPKAFAPG